MCVGSHALFCVCTMMSDDWVMTRAAQRKERGRCVVAYKRTQGKGSCAMAVSCSICLRWRLRVTRMRIHSRLLIRDKSERGVQQRARWRAAVWWASDEGAVLLEASLGKDRVDLLELVEEVIELLELGHESDLQLRVVAHVRHHRQPAGESVAAVVRSHAKARAWNACGPLIYHGQNFSHHSADAVLEAFYHAPLGLARFVHI
mmetsp:Transcript_17251/g.31333  ORF Transcript_17251/g.31333 Transcript_17251/m.31333 type:complete len:203 (-) Transcript_17251:218-826(-)